MSALVFVDTNVFVYARHAHETVKRPVAAEWIARLWSARIGRTSVQVLTECYSVLTRAASPNVPADVAWDYVQSLLAWNPLPVDGALLPRAIDIQRSHRLNWWDCLIVSSAQQQGCSVLLTEDLQDGAVFGGVTVRNPFVLGVSDDLAVYDTSPAEPAYPRRGRPRRARRVQPRTAAAD